MRRTLFACMLALLALGRVSTAQTTGSDRRAEATPTVERAAARLADPSAVRARLGLVAEYGAVHGVEWVFKRTQTYREQSIHERGVVAQDPGGGHECPRRFR